MRKIAIIEDGYVRDVQVFVENPDVIENSPNWEEYFRDVQYPALYIGIFEGVDEDAIKKKAAEYQGVHPDIISLIEVGCAECKRQPMKPMTDNLDDCDCVLCPACGGELARADDYFGIPKYCPDCGQLLTINLDMKRKGA